MGTWGIGPFDNDSAGDMVAKMMKSVKDVAAGDESVFGQSQHGGWNRVMRAIEIKNNWIRYDEEKRKYVLTDAGRKALHGDSS